MKTPAETRRILDALEGQHPGADTELHHTNAFELLVATILSAQCTDERVNIVTKDLFKKYRSAGDYATAAPEALEKDIQSTGFYRNKAKSLRGMAAALVEGHGGKVPQTMEELTALVGVGRKTANVVLGNAFGRNEGIAVDTHVQRLSRRLFLTAEEDPEKIERDLTALLPREEWTRFALLLQDHGRKVCKARKPECAVCPVADLCPSAEI